MLSSREITRLSKLRRYKKERAQSGHLVIFGLDEVRELAPQLDVVQVFATDKALFDFAPKVPHHLCPKNRWRQLSGFEAERGIGMEIRYSPPDMGEPRRLVVCDGISDPGNLGTIIRTARAFGYDGLICLEETADPFGDKALRASKGQALFMPSAKSFDLTGYTKIAADSRGGPLERCSGPIACILGNEGRGVRRELLEGAKKVGITMQNGVESLNVAAAAAILLHML